MAKVERLSALAHRDDSETALAHTMAAAAAGDEDWQQWLDEYQRGEALIVCLELTVELSHGPPLHLTNTGVWIETDAHAPKVEQQLSELMSKDFETIARQLAKRGERIDIQDLRAMYIHVELGEDIRCALDGLPERTTRRRSPPDFDVKLSKQHLGRSG